MDAVMIELLLWAGLILFLWMLKDTMGKLESDIEHSGRTVPLSGKIGRIPRQSQAEKLLDPIGRYRDMPIYRYAVIDGRTYEFSHVCAGCSGAPIDSGMRCIEPGLMYLECREAPPIPEAN
jgi:hypothetical protein